MFYYILPIYILNGIYVLYSIYTSAKTVYTKFPKTEPDTEWFDELMDKQKNKLMKLVVAVPVIIIVFLVIGIMIGILMIPFWVPIIVWIRNGIFWGLFSMAIGAIIGAIFKARVIKKKVNDSRWMEASMINDIIYIVTIFMSGYIFTDLSKLSITEMVMNVYDYSFMFNETLMVLLPIMIFAILITNVYLLYKRTSYVFRKDISKYKVTTKKLVFTVLISSSFIGLFYFNEIDTSYVSESSAQIIKGAFNLFLVIVTAMFIPALFGVLQDKKNQKAIQPINLSNVIEIDSEINDE